MHAACISWIHSRVSSKDHRLVASVEDLSKLNVMPHSCVIHPSGSEANASPKSQWRNHPALLAAHKGARSASAAEAAAAPQASATGNQQWPAASADSLHRRLHKAQPAPSVPQPSQQQKNQPSIQAQQDDLASSALRFPKDAAGPGLVSPNLSSLHKCNETVQGYTFYKAWLPRHVSHHARAMGHGMAGPAACQSTC